MFTMLVFWAFTLTVCALALFAHSVFMLRKLIHGQHLSAWKMGAIVLSALVSIWSLFVAFGAFTMMPNFDGIIGLHITIQFFMAFKANIDMATVSCQVQTAIVVAVFLMSAYLERRMFPAVQPVSQLVTLKERRPLR